MKLFRAYQKEIRELHISIIVAVVLTGYCLSIVSIESLRHFLNPAINNSLMSTAINCLVMWIGLTILISYVRFVKVSMDTRELHSMIAGMSNDVVLVVNPSRKIVMCNEAVTKLFGYSPEEIMNRETHLLYKDRRPAQGAAMGIFEQLERLGFHYGYAVGIRKDGVEVPLEIITGNLRGRPGVVLQIRDATKLVHVEEAEKAKTELVNKLEYHVKRLKELEASRDALAQMIVHDMKTPLQVVLGNLELMEKDLVSDKKMPDQAHLANALSQSRRLVGMVEGILQVSRLESKALHLKPEQVDLRALISSVVEDADTLLGGRSMTLSLPAEPLEVQADVEVLRRVINNLVGNAMKHGGADVSIQVKAEDNHGFARFSVTDNGPGILADNRNRIFEKFFHIETSGSKGSPSTGLGLTFCKLAIEAHQGDIGLESKAGQGSTFWFNLPLIPKPATV